MPTYNRIIMAPQKEENKKQKHSHRKLSKLAIKRLMREKRALQNVPHDAEIPEDLNINVDQAGANILIQSLLKSNKNSSHNNFFHFLLLGCIFAQIVNSLQRGQT